MNDATKGPERIWVFDRYVNGVLMAEGVEVTRAASFEEACVSAARLASRGKNGEVPVLVLSTPAALVASPEVAALIREAEARGMERAARIIDDMPQNEGDDFAGRIRAERDALRGEKEPK